MPIQIPFFYESINRNAIVVKPKQPLYDWINALYPQSPVLAKEEGTVYLIRERDNNEIIERWIKRNFDKIFLNELNDWHTDENDWPAKRTYKMFQEWFEVEIHSFIIDLEDMEIIKE